MVLNLKNIIVKRIACFILIILIIFSSSYHKKVEAIAIVDDVALLAVVGIGLAGLATIGVVSSDFSVSSSDIAEIKSKIEAGGETIITGVNNLGTAIKDGADKAQVKALATGATIYGMLQVMQEVLFPSKPYGSITNKGALVAIQGNLALYCLCNSDVYGSDHPLLSYQFSRTAEGNTFDLYKFSIYNSTSRSSESSYTYTLYNTDTWSIINSKTDTGFYFKDYGFYGIELLSTDILSLFFKGSSFTLPATTIAESPSVTLPVTLPDTIINNITNYVANPTSDLVLGIPEGVTYTDDDLIIVDPTTSTDNPPVDEPTDPSDNYADVLSATLAILTAVSPISGLLDNLNINIGESIGDLIDVVTGTTDGVLTDIGSIVEPITSSIDFITGETTETIDTSKLEGLNALIFDKFPFCIPFDVYHFFQLLDADPVAPAFTFPFSLPGGFDMDLKIEFSAYEAVGAFIRNINYILFVVFLMYSTKNLIWK